ncbi:MAG: NADH-quinone oxidoreductase subunit C [Acidimicrobiia bacterium]
MAEATSSQKTSAAGAPAQTPSGPARPTRDELQTVGVEALSLLQSELGGNLLQHAANFGELVVRVAPQSWRRAAEISKEQLGCDYLSFVSGIDWMPAPRVAEDDGDTSTPAQPKEMTYGVAGSAGRFQVFGRVASTSRRFGITFKVDIDEARPTVESWVPVYAGADWHERECWEMLGVSFEGHPALRHLYLPSEFEGHPLRKDFPLLAREVKPWPGLVDVEGMPGEAPGEESGAPEEGAA